MTLPQLHSSTFPWIFPYKIQASFGSGWSKSTALGLPQLWIKAAVHSPYSLENVNFQPKSYRNSLPSYRACHGDVSKSMDPHQKSMYFFFCEAFSVYFRQPQKGPGFPDFHCRAIHCIGKFRIKECVALDRLKRIKGQQMMDKTHGFWITCYHLWNLWTCDHFVKTTWWSIHNKDQWTKSCYHLEWSKIYWINSWNTVGWKRQMWSNISCVSIGPWRQCFLTDGGLPLLWLRSGVQHVVKFCRVFFKYLSGQIT